MSLKNGVERVLHVPGNYTGGILEMTLVVDCNLPEKYVKEFVSDIAATLRMHSEVFRNVRLNLLMWKSDEEMTNRVIPISFCRHPAALQSIKKNSRKRSWKRLRQS